MAIFIPILLYAIFANWHSIWTYKEIKANHVETIETKCISVAIDRTDEPNGRTPYRLIYNFALGNGATASIYKDLVDHIFSSEEGLEQQLVTGQTMEFTYVPKPLFTNGAFVLLSVSDNGRIIINEADVIYMYYRRLKTAATVVFVAFGIALQILLIAPICYLCRKYSDYKKKLAKKKKKERRNSKQE